MVEDHSLHSVPVECLGFSARQIESLHADDITTLGDLLDFGAGLDRYLTTLASGQSKNLNRIRQLLTHLGNSEQDAHAIQQIRDLPPADLPRRKLARPSGPRSDWEDLLSALKDRSDLGRIPVRQLGLQRSLMGALRRKGVANLGDLLEQGPDVESYFRSLGGVGPVKARAARESLAVVLRTLLSASGNDSHEAMPARIGEKAEESESAVRAINATETVVPNSARSAVLDREKLTRDLTHLLKAHPGQNKRELLNGLEAIGWRRLTTTDVNGVLYQRSASFIRDDSRPPHWSLAIEGPATLASVEPGLPSSLVLGRYRGPQPRSWQQEALDAWLAAGRRGVVEAVTGTGKTALGVIAAADAVARGRPVLVIVPGRDLLDQWHYTLTQEIPSARIGRLGDGHGDCLVDHDVVVATVQSASRVVVLPDGSGGLMIADEVHHYGAESYSLSLEDGFDERLGLTATYERSDDGVLRYLAPYFSADPAEEGNEVVARCDYERGLADGILARFRVALLAVGFQAAEQERYEELDSIARRARASLVDDYGCPSQPFGEFMHAVSRLSEGGNDNGRITRCARRYLSAFTKRRALLADCSRKLDALSALVPVLARTQRALVFTETIDSAAQVAERLRKAKIFAHAYTSDLKREERQALLFDFKQGRVKVLAAPRVLDEGVDVPEADLGVILAASHSRRQMIQRMGRIIRPKKDGRAATFMILYVKGTCEDPDLGAYDSFLNEVVDVAEDVRAFPRGTKPGDLLRWYSSA